MYACIHRLFHKHIINRHGTWLGYITSNVQFIFSMHSLVAEGDRLVTRSKLCGYGETERLNRKNSALLKGSNPLTCDVFITLK